MKRSGTADLPLHGGRVPPWLASRMTELGYSLGYSSESAFSNAFKRLVGYDKARNQTFRAASLQRRRQSPRFRT
jgi:AraC-like DNA-binding protein